MFHVKQIAIKIVIFIGFLKLLSPNFRTVRGIFQTYVRNPFKSFSVAIPNQLHNTIHHYPPITHLPNQSPYNSNPLKFQHLFLPTPMFNVYITSN